MYKIKREFCDDDGLVKETYIDLTVKEPRLGSTALFRGQAYEVIDVYVPVGYDLVVRYKPMNIPMSFYRVYDEYIHISEDVKALRCECGADSCGPNRIHSDFCPKFEKTTYR